jgi:hypothetical protein
MGESILRHRLVPFGSEEFSDRPAYRKGIGLIFPNQDVDTERRRKRNPERRRVLRQEFSFLVNSVGGPWNRIARREGSARMAKRLNL